MSYNITFKVKTDLTIDPESVTISGTPPIGEEIFIHGHEDTYSTNVGIRVGELSVGTTKHKKTNA